MPTWEKQDRKTRSKPEQIRQRFDIFESDISHQKERICQRRKPNRCAISSTRHCEGERTKTKEEKIKRQAGKKSILFKNPIQYSVKKTQSSPLRDVCFSPDRERRISEVTQRHWLSNVRIVQENKMAKKKASRSFFFASVLFHVSTYAVWQNRNLRMCQRRFRCGMKESRGEKNQPKKCELQISSFFSLVCLSFCSFTLLSREETPSFDFRSLETSFSLSALVLSASFNLLELHPHDNSDTLACSVSHVSYSSLLFFSTLPFFASSLHLSSLTTNQPSHKQDFLCILLLLFSILSQYLFLFSYPQYAHWSVERL